MRLSIRSALAGTPASAARLAAIALAFLLCTLPASAQNANVTPKRITFDRLGKSATVFVFNQGNQPGVFNIELIDRAMTPSGEIAPVSDVATKPDLRAPAARLQSARPLVVVTPRRVALAPGKGQTIRVRAAAPATLAPGEYRTHLTVTALPPADAGLSADEAAAGDRGEIAFRINTVLGISIPVIVRHGAVDVRAAFDGGRIETQTLPPEPGIPAHKVAVLVIDLVRAGGSSLFGDIEVKSLDGGAKRGPLGQLRGVGVYTEIDRRTLRLPLARIPQPGERLVVTFSDDDTTPGTELAKATVVAT